MAVSGVILNGVSLSTCLPVCLSACLPVCLSVSLFDCLSVCRGGVDPDQRTDVGGDPVLVLLHLWSDGPGWTRLLAERLAQAAGGCLRAPLPVLCLQLVSKSQCSHQCAL